MRLIATAFLVSLAGVACGKAPPPVPADLVLRGGTIVTLDPTNPRGEALAARGDRIVAVGSAEEMASLIGPDTRVVDLKGRTAYPGFIEGHGHLTGLGRARRTVDVSHARTWEEVVETIRREAANRPPGSWVLGWGWHQEKWDRKPEPSVEGYPTQAALTAAVPDNPVILKHAAGGHLGIVNAAALRLAGIDRSTPDPAGGEILHDARGEPTGVLRENAYDLALDAYESTRSPEQRAADTRLEVAVAMEECLKKGITSFQDLHSPFVDIDVFRAMADEGKLPVRLYVMAMEPNDVLRTRLKDYRWIGLDNGHLTVRAIKKQIDGALGSHGAWLLEPYLDLPSSSGLETQT
ncbi:MAG TPA: amidohydrolase family protein, partial [Candidatus Polarisedimenticolaceae bacterium]|nr:amidohydrolase family protein [Candidatus Polarisedimenticolaceae bacterium]